MGLRFISPSRQYRYVVIHDKVVPDANGFMRTVEPGYTAEWEYGTLSPYEKQVAREKLIFRGVGTNMDGTAIDPATRASVFDTAVIEDPKMRAKVEEILLANQGEDFILVEPPKTPAPWATYDELTVQGKRNSAVVAERNLEIAAATGVSTQHLIDYERENRNDEKIIAAYEANLGMQTLDKNVEELIEA